jgi:signal transduction protein with GAF and PtsI domain
MVDEKDENELTEKKQGLFEKKGEEFLEMFRKGQEFTQDLLRDNERLRYRVVQLEEAGKRKLEAPIETGQNDSGVVEELSSKLARYEKRLAELEGRLGEIEAENVDFAQRYLDVEEQNNNLANLYVASFQLHSTLDYEEVLQIILEIIINLVGAEVFSIFMLDEKTQQLNCVAAEGVNAEQIRPVSMGEGVIGESAANNQSYFNENPPGDLAELYEDPLVCIPLTIKDDMIGVICLYSLLQQKESFAPVDFELFTLLAGHAATAIFSSRLFSESKRKLSTFQGFLDLLSQ